MSDLLPASGTPFTRYPVEALLRGAEPGPRSLTDTRDLVRLVRYLPEGSGVRLVLHSAGGSGRVSIWLDLFGAGSGTVTAADLGYASALTLALGEPRSIVEESPALTDAYELRRITTAPMFTASAEELATQPEWLSEAKSAQQAVVAQPKPSMDTSGELLGALTRSAHDIWVVTALMAPSSLDAGLVLDEVDAVIAAQGRAGYAGAIVCARTVVVGTGPISPAVLAGLAKRSPEVEALPLDPREAVGLFVDPANALRGRAVAEGHAVSLARIPSTASGTGIGVASRRPEVTVRPLDPPLPTAQTGVRFGSAIDIAGDRVDVELDAPDLGRHTYVEGKSGAGKSACLKNVAISWLDTGYPLVVLDPHGDVAEAVAARAAERPGRRTYFIRHGDLAHPIGLNLLAEPDPELWEQNVDALLESMARIIDPGSEGMFGERAKRTFWLVATAGRHVYGARLSVHIVQTLLLRKEYIRDLARAVRRIAPDISRRLVAELVDLADKEWNDLISWYQSRFQMWQRTRALRDSTGTGIDAIDMAAVLDGEADLIVDLASMQLGDPVAGILGGLYLRKIREAMGRRRRRDPALVVFDEAHLFHDEAPDRLLAEGRKFGLGLLIASQSADNLSPRLARAIEANVGSYISLRTGVNLATTAGVRLGGFPAAELTRLPDRTAIASLSARGVPTDPFTLVIDHFERAEAEGWTRERVAARAADVAAETVERLWRPYAEVTVPTDAEVVAVLRNRLDTEPGPTSHERGVDGRLEAWFDARRRSTSTSPGEPGDDDAALTRVGAGDRS
jgi:hypothetical protein